LFSSTFAAASSSLFDLAKVCELVPVTIEGTFCPAWTAGFNAVHSCERDFVAPADEELAQQMRLNATIGISNNQRDLFTVPIMAP
jgi:hypothetical protein